MKVVESVDAWRALRAEWRGQSVGFVPTMGALHPGHLALVARARHENARALVSIFVNPTQFNDANDLKNYPQPLEQDLALLEKAGCDAVFLPRAEELYRDRYRYEIREKEISLPLCGATRPGHFTGMLTVVLKLLNIADADRAYFGEKDYQQLKLIEGMVDAFFLKTMIVGVATLRESDGLAMSSRNLRLSAEERALAPKLRQVLVTATSLADARAALTDLGFRVDYLEEMWGRRFVAAFLGGVRLIDNVAL